MGRGVCGIIENMKNPERQNPTPEGFREASDTELEAMIIHAKPEDLDPSIRMAMVSEFPVQSWLKDRLRDIYWLINIVYDKPIGDERTKGEMQLTQMWVNLNNEWVKRHAQ